MVFESVVIVRNVANNTLKVSTVESQPRPLKKFFFKFMSSSSNYFIFVKQIQVYSGPGRAKKPIISSFPSSFPSHYAIQLDIYSSQKWNDFKFN